MKTEDYGELYKRLIAQEIQKQVDNEIVYDLGVYDKPSKPRNPLCDYKPNVIPIMDRTGRCNGFYAIDETSFKKLVGEDNINKNGRSYSIRSVVNSFREVMNTPLVPLPTFDPFKSGNRIFILRPPKWMYPIYGKKFPDSLIICNIDRDNICELFRQFIGLNYKPIARPRSIIFEQKEQPKTNNKKEKLKIQVYEK